MNFVEALMEVANSYDKELDYDGKIVNINKDISIKRPF